MKNIVKMKFMDYINRLSVRCKLSILVSVIFTVCVAYPITNRVIESNSSLSRRYDQLIDNRTVENYTGIEIDTYIKRRHGGPCEIENKTRTECGCLEISEIPEKVRYYCCTQQHGCRNIRDENCPSIEVEYDSGDEAIDCP
jgi:hypothetical protein